MNMIGMLSGTVSGRCVVVQGVGYVVNTSVPLLEGSEVNLLITTVVREDDISLYGFPNAVDQELFMLLRKLPGVGASVAMALLRDVGSGQIVQAISGGDHKILAKAAGVGIKKAESIALAGKGKLSKTLLEALEEAPGEILSSELVELTNTLIELGFNPEASRGAAKVALETVDPSDEAELLGAALAHLRRQK